MSIFLQTMPVLAIYFRMTIFQKCSSSFIRCGHPLPSFLQPKPQQSIEIDTANTDKAHVQVLF